MGLTLKKNEFLCPESVFLTQNCPPPHVNFSNFQVEEFFHFVNFWNVSMRKEQQQPPWLINFVKIWSEHVLKIKTKITKFGNHRVRGFWLAAASLVIRASEPPPGPDRVKASHFQPVLIEFTELIWFNSIRHWGGHDDPQNVFDHCVQTLMRRKHPCSTKKRVSMAHWTEVDIRWLKVDWTDFTLIRKFTRKKRIYFRFILDLISPYMVKKYLIVLNKGFWSF